MGMCMAAPPSSLRLAPCMCMCMCMFHVHRHGHVHGWASLLTQVGTDCAGSECVHGVVHGPCEQTVGHWFFWVLLAVVILTASWAAIYLNKAMQVAARAGSGLTITPTRRTDCHLPAAVRLAGVWQHRVRARVLCDVHPCVGDWRCYRVQ